MPAKPKGDAPPVARPRTWLEMRERIEKILERRTGEGVATWSTRVNPLGDVDEPPVRAWLTDEVLLRAAEVGEVDAQARKTWVSLVTPKRTFALVRATTRDRVDVGLRLPDAALGGRLLPATGLGNDYINVRLALKSVDEVDEGVSDYLDRAYRANI